jgi:pimeloyl-ACP methyl ester carboxylesterase
LHISQNGKELSEQLQQLVERWPEDIEDLSVLAHSMGGLVIRSAVQQAKQQGMNWPERLNNLVFLGTPHHGAPLERAGNWLDLILDHAPYVKPFTALGQMRSSGITDLRYGNLLTQDWDGHDRFKRKPDRRENVPLPEFVNCYTVAATLAEKRNILSDHLLGDGLVPLRSALGQHDDADRTLAFPDPSQRIVFNTSHMELLHSPAVNDQIVSWLSAAQCGPEFLGH